MVKITVDINQQMRDNAQEMSRKTLHPALKVLESERKKIAFSRDRLRDLISDLEKQSESCDRALENLEAAIDALSEYV